MTQVQPIKQLNKSVVFLQDIQQNLNEAFSKRQAQLLDTVAQKKQTLHKKRVVLMGQVKEQPLVRLYDFQTQSLDVVQMVASRLESILPVGKTPLKMGQTQVVHLMNRIQAKQEKIQSPDIENYDQLNVKSVNANLDTLDHYQLLKLKQYEESHKNRVTVLREVNSLIA